MSSPRKPSRLRAAPEYNPASKVKVPQAGDTAPEPRARPQPSLVLPGAPDVADLAARYAATLKAPEEVFEEPVVEEATLPAEPTLVALPHTRPAPEPEPVRVQTRAERRRGIRPLGMAFALVGLAALPLAVKAPPLEKGPEMPVIGGFRIQPALGITWSLNRRPVETVTGEWRAPAAPASLAVVPLASSVRLSDSVALPPLPLEAPASDVIWTEVRPVGLVAPSEVHVPDGSRLVAPEVAPAPLPLPEAPSARTETTDEIEAPSEGGVVSAPPRPATLREEGLEAPVPPSAPTRPDASVAAIDPLRVTILAPTRGDQKVADEIAQTVQNEGHELVRVQSFDFNVSSRNLRYFHPEDRAAAAELAARYDADATPEFGQERLEAFYAKLARGDAVVDRGEHAVF